MADVKWIKIAVDIFDDEKILLIEALPSKYEIITCWFKLLCLAGKQNNSGVFTLNDKIAYTDEMLATIFRMDLNTVRLSLDTFEKFGMIDIIDGVITIPNWSKHQNLDAYQKKLEYDRNYRAKKREEQKDKTKLLESRATNRTKIVSQDIDKEEDKEIDKEYILSNANILSASGEANGVFEYWNDKKIVNHRSLNSSILNAINKALKIYGFEQITTAIDRYSMMYHDNNYFFSYKWTLEDFLKQSNALPTFLDGGQKWENYISSGSLNKQRENEMLKNFSVKDFLEGAD